MAKKYENIENIGKLITDGLVTELVKKVSVAEKTANDILKKLSELENAKLAKKIEEERLAAEKLAEERAAAIAEAEKQKAEEEKIAAETESKPKEEVKAKTPTVEKTENKTFINKDNRIQRDRPQRPGAPAFNNSPQRPKPLQQRPGAPVSAASNAQANKPKNFGPDKKKQSYDKTYVEKERHAVSKHALQKQQGAKIADFDENKSGYRKLRVKKDKKQQNFQTIKIEHAIVTTDDIPIKTLSEKLGISAVDITKKL